jgi:transcriptional regulator with XRE-family HTH domain
MVLPFGYGVNRKKLPMSNLFSDRLKALRGDRKKAEFARIIGVSAPDYQRYENGRMPRADVLSDISVRLGMTVDELLSGNSQNPTSPTATHCRYPEACDIQAEFGQVREELASVEASLASMTAQLDAVTRLLGAALGSVLPSQRDHKTPNKRLAG